MVFVKTPDQNQTILPCEITACWDTNIRSDVKLSTMISQPRKLYAFFRVVGQVRSLLVSVILGVEHPTLGYFAMIHEIAHELGKILEPKKKAG